MFKANICVSLVCQCSCQQKPEIYKVDFGLFFLENQQYVPILIELGLV